MTHKKLDLQGFNDDPEGVGGDSCLRPFYPPQVFVAENHPNFEQQLWKFANGSFATVFSDV